jgi:hypothetical protein
MITTEMGDSHRTLLEYLAHSPTWSDRWYTAPDADGTPHPVERRCVTSVPGRVDASGLDLSEWRSRQAL